MTESENLNTPEPTTSEEETGSDEEETGRVFVGFHPFGGVRLQAEDVRLSPQEAFILAGQLHAHATLLIHQGYLEQAQAAQAARAVVGKGDIILPGR